MRGSTHFKKDLGLVGTMSGLKAAYTLRSLDNGYAGNILKIIRDADNVPMDFTISEGQFPSSDILSFLGSDKGRVHTWYDSSGNGMDAIQTDPTRQPIIANNGSLSKNLLVSANYELK